MNGRGEVIIIGGGLAGGLLSIMLRQRGLEVKLFEKRLDSRTGATYGGRSINLALSLRGLKALERVGLARQALELAIPMRGRLIHTPDADTTFQPYSPHEGEYINSISRSGLNELLLDRAQDAGVALHFGQACVDVSFDARRVVFEDIRSGKRTSVEAAVVVGADGAGSSMRRAMEAAGLTDSSSEMLEHGYKELSIPAIDNGRHAMERVEALHIWPRRSFMLIALPNLDGSFTCTLFLALKGDPSFASLDTDDRVRTFFEREFPDAVQRMPELAKEFRNNPVATLGTVRCYPWSTGDFGLLLGDAAHAILPFYGQGMNCAFEDCALLDDLLEEEDRDWGAVFSRFESARKKDTDAIAHLALGNFLEMRDKVADERFALRKQFELELARRFPNEYTPIYSHVTFSTIPYSKALSFSETQARALDAFLKDLSSIDEVDWQQAAVYLRSGLLGSEQADSETT